MGFGLGELNPSNWSVGGTSVGNLVTKGRNAAEAGLAGSLNLAFPGSTNKTQNLVSKGAKSMLNTGTGRSITDTLSGIGIGTGIVGAGALAAPYLGSAPPVVPSGGGEASMALADGSLPSGAVDMSGTALPSAAMNPNLSDTAATAGKTAATSGMTTAQKIMLGLGGANMLLNKPQPLNPNLMAGATPAQNVSTQILDQYQKGQLNPADQYNIAKWAQDTKAAKQQYYAQAGLADSSMAQQDIAQVDAQASAMRDQALQNMLQGGLNAAGIANTAVGQAVQLQIAQDQQAQQAQQQFFQMLALTSATGGLG